MLAELQANPAAVYAAAQVPLPAAPTPQPAPGKPTDFAVTLGLDGSVMLSWNSADAAASGGPWSGSMADSAALVTPATIVVAGRTIVVWFATVVVSDRIGTVEAGGTTQSSTTRATTRRFGG